MQKTLAFPVDEYQRRARAVQAQMGRAGVDLMLPTTLASVCYLSGIESVSPHKLWAVAVPRSGMPALFCQDFESHNALLSSWLEPRFTYGVHPGADAIAAVAQMIESLGFSDAQIGMESAYCWSSLSAQAMQRLQEMLPRAAFVEASDCVGRAMAIKSPVEVECVRRAARMTVQGMDAAVEALRDGATDNDLAAAAFDTMTRAGSEYSAYPVIVTTGSRSGIPHSTYRRTPIARGDAVFLEFAGVVNRYHAPMMRTAVLGPAPAELRALAEAATNSVEAMLAALRPGRPVVEVAAAGQAQLRGLDPKIVWHGYFGYSVGIGFPPEWSDCPELLIRLDAPPDEVLKPGMVFHLSTSLREIGVRGATCCETVLITESGCEVLTSPTRGLIQLP